MNGSRQLSIWDSISCSLSMQRRGPPVATVRRRHARSAGIGTSGAFRSVPPAVGDPDAVPTPESGHVALTGPAYKGHVFWDTDVFVVPALAALAPEGALAALRYRWRRLDAARRRASDEERQGARFPWESAATGDEVTPTIGRDLHGGSGSDLDRSARRAHRRRRRVGCVSRTWRGPTIRTPRRTIAADLLVETARYWQSRIELDSDGSGHIRSVIGPDEYHERVDDNAYTNVMARWNLTTAADLADRLALPIGDEAARWRSTSDRIVDGFDAARGALRAVRRVLRPRRDDGGDPGRAPAGGRRTARP